MNIIERVQAPTPAFFRKLRNISLALAAIGGAVLAVPAGLPAIVLKIAGYIAVAGAVGGTISQAVTTGDEDPKNAGPGGQQLP